MSISTTSCLAFLFLLTSVGPDMPLRIEDFTLGGQTYLTSDNCLRLTDAQSYMAGSIWYKQPVNLTRPFSFQLSVKMGCKDYDGADGMVFVMTRKGNQTGYRGEGIGFAGLVPSVGIEIDTYRNYHLNDPMEDHLALMINGRMGHFSNLSSPKHIANIEDCKRHNFVIRWNPGSKQLAVYLDNKETLSAKVDLVGDVFAGNPVIYWGMTAGTGRFNNIQEVCFQRMNAAAGPVRGRKY